MVLFDAGILIKLLDARTPDSQREKLDYLLATLQKTRVRILIPTPALAEFYVKADPDVVANFKENLHSLLRPSMRRRRWNVRSALQMQFARVTRKPLSQMRRGRKSSLIIRSSQLPSAMEQRPFTLKTQD